MNDLPRGWTTAAIRQLCSLENGRAFKPTDWTEHGLPIVRIQNLNREGAAFNRFAGDVAERYRLRGGELLFAWSGTPGTSFGAHVWRGGDAVLNQHIFRVDFDEAFVDKRFFRHAINQKLEELINVAHGGVGLRHVTKGVFENTEVLVPPLPEQKRIADKLDALLARVDACRERLDRVPGILKRFRQSVLAAATSGELTREWREDRGLTRVGWRMTTFDQICREITVGFVGKMSEQYRPRGVPFLRSQNVRPFKFDPRELRFVSPEFHHSIPKSILRPGDVAVVRTGAPGQCCVIPTELDEANCSDLVIVRPGPDLDSRFAVVFINSETSQSFVRSEQVGVAQSHFNVGSMKRAPVDLPSLAEQVEIARRVDELFELADKLEARTRCARQVTAPLAPSLLSKAFRGALVPQDPTDEPAAALLARLRPGADSTTDAAGKGGSRRSRSPI